MIALVTTRKRKDIGNPKTSLVEKSKVRLVEHTYDGLLDGTGDAIAKQQRGVRTLRDIRQKGVKILSRIRARGNRSSIVYLDCCLTDYSTGSAPGANAVTPVSKPSSDVTVDAQIRNNCHSQDLHTATDPTTPTVDETPRLTLHHIGSSLTQLTNPAVYDGESEPSLSVQPVKHTPIHTSRSTPSLSRQLTIRLSSALLQNITVVHRPKLNARPTVLTRHPKRESSSVRRMPSDHVPGAPSLMLQVSNGPESSNGPISQSTAPTSLSSGGAVAAETARRRLDGSIEIHHTSAQLNLHDVEQGTKYWLQFPRQDAPRFDKPSIAAVEKAAAAKIFFESYYNQLLSVAVSPRSVRRRQLERKIFAMALPNDQRQHKRQRWYAAENHHLRQTRVMKSKTIARQSIKGVHLSNYNIVRVLGKGSFGVVRLVREKSNNESTARTASDTDRQNDVDSSHIDLASSPPMRKVKQVYAMKVIRKSDMLRNSQEGHLRAERDFLVASESSRWVVPLVSAFQDHTNLYLVMEYMLGGDFLGLLLREDILDENVAK